MMIILNLDWSPCQIATEITYCSKLISDSLQAIDRAHGPRNGIWNDPVGKEGKEYKTFFSPLCVMHASVRFCSSAVTLPKMYLCILFSFQPNFRRCVVGQEAPCSEEIAVPFLKHSS